MRWRLGRNVRRLMPVTLRPTPPRYFALPRRAIWLPSTGFLPQTSHCIPIAHLGPRTWRRMVLKRNLSIAARQEETRRPERKIIAHPEPLQRPRGSEFPPAPRCQSPLAPPPATRTPPPPAT